MRPYLEIIKTDLRLALRDRAVLFFNYLFPLIFFFAFAELMDAERGGTISWVVSMVLLLGILGNGLFGAGMRAVQERENNILRRFKVAPISPLPLLLGSLATGWILYVPALLLILLLATGVYGMPWPQRPLSLFLVITLGILAFRSLGLILASVANSMQEINILVQIFYTPMLFLSGALFPITLLPDWVQILAQYLPATYLVTGLQGVFLQQENFLANWTAALALLLTTFLSLFVSRKLFRWEKEEKVPASAKAWVAAVLVPFLVLGSSQAFSREEIRKARILYRNLQRNENLLIRGARLFLGDGEVVESGSVLIRQGRIAALYRDEAPGGEELKAEVLEASGKTLLPGLIDAHAHLSAPGAPVEVSDGYDLEKAMSRAAASYLYCGVTAVKSAGDPLELVLALKSRVVSGEWLGAEIFACGPLFTAEQGHGTEYFETLPEWIRPRAYQQWLRLPQSTEEARQQVRQLKAAGTDGIKAVLESGSPARPFRRLDTTIFRALAEEAQAQGLPLVVHTGESQDIRDALQAGAAGIEHGSTRQELPPELLQELASRKIFYDPTLSVLEAWLSRAKREEWLLDRSLVQQVGPRERIEAARRWLQSGESASVTLAEEAFRRAQANLKAAYQAGVPLVAGTDSGNFLVWHGAALHRELQLWVEAGIPPPVVLQAATSQAARLLGAENRLGFLRPGYDADLLLVDGNPLEDISATERISAVIFRGERIRRERLFEQE